MQIVMTIQTAQPEDALRAMARNECRRTCEIQRSSDAGMGDPDGKRRVTIAFEDMADRDRFRRGLADLPLLSPDVLIVSPDAPSTSGFFRRLFS